MRVNKKMSECFLWDRSLNFEELAVWHYCGPEAAPILKSSKLMA